MSTFFEISFCVLLFTLIVVAYLILMRGVLPKRVLKSYSLDADDLGRGIRKMKTETERAIVYEPHPSIRKYLHQYALYTDMGYKKLICNVDTTVRELAYVVQMFDNCNRRIDVLQIEDIPDKYGRTSEIVLHPETSYVALSLKSINGAYLTRAAERYYRVVDLLKYALFAFIGNFITFISITVLLGIMMNALDGPSLPSTLSVWSFVSPSVIIAVACTLLNVWQGGREGIKVTLNGRRR